MQKNYNITGELCLLDLHDFQHRYYKLKKVFVLLRFVIFEVLGKFKDAETYEVILVIFYHSSDH